MSTPAPAATTAHDHTSADVATGLAALGHEARLAIFRALVRAGDEGLPIHAIQGRLNGMPRSTLAHHLQMLVSAGLVRRSKVGAEVVHAADYRRIRSLIDYLTDRCCAEPATRSDADATSEHVT